MTLWCSTTATLLLPNKSNGLWRNLLKEQPNKKKWSGCKLFSSLATASVYILISINKVANQFSHYFVRNILLFTTTAWAKAAQHTKTIKLTIIIIFLPFYSLIFVILLRLLLASRLCSSTINWSIRTYAYYLDMLIFLFTTTASTSAAQQIANTNPNTIITLSFL